MAKKKESVYKSWEDIDLSLKQLGALKIKKADLEGELTEEINVLKSKYANLCTGINSEIKDIEKEISRFCDMNKDEFLTKRSKNMNFGSISYRLSEKVICASIPAAIKALKHLNLNFCLRVKEELDKDAIREANLDANTLTKIGVQIIKEDKLTIEPDIEEIKTIE